MAQRIETWALGRWDSSARVKFGACNAIGSRRLWRGEPQTTTGVRLRATGPVCPAIGEFTLQREPVMNQGSGPKQSRFRRQCLRRTQGAAVQVAVCHAALPIYVTKIGLQGAGGACSHAALWGGPAEARGLGSLWTSLREFCSR